MNLTDTGESRVHGYLFVLERSLKSFLPPEAVRDAAREIESHIRERVLSADAAPNERDALERILEELGPPLRVAQAYSAERTIDEAVATGRFVPMLRAVGHLAITTMTGFFAALGLLTGYLTSFAFFTLAVLKPIFPHNVGVVYRHAWPIGFGAQFPVQPGTMVEAGYWMIPVALFCGLGTFAAMQRAARRFLSRWPKARRREL
ncbi:MAG: rane protein [Acidobacteria bacterium]|nr:rane protein [Acidobacteriota bacterium]